MKLMREKEVFLHRCHPVERLGGIFILKFNLDHNYLWSFFIQNN